MDIRLFAYGTLEVSPIMKLVTGREFPSVSATVEGYARYLLKGQAYPGIIKEPLAKTQGTLYFELDKDALQRLDMYEDTCYEKCTLQVTTEDGRTLDALAYVVPDERKDLMSSNHWNKELFIQKELESFLKQIQR